ncbi:MAG: hypothetical protein D6815_02330 [Candidatus Dadabacteria bacterium]|nr:MAG: hypothetical protein D6815_02330 [Candidatus Dadabacteria bacterium]
MGNSRRTFILAAAVFVAGLLYFGSFVRYGINLDDEGTLLYQIERVVDGQRVYTDFHIGYTPAIYYFHAFLFRLFGTNVIPVRAVLAVVNAAALAGLTLLAAAIAPLWAAWLPALFYAVSIPVHPGEFAAFNVPYPVWYNVAFFAYGLLAVRRFGSRGGLGWLVLAGALAGLDFMFKPNVGLFQLAASALILLSCWPMPRPSRRGLATRWPQLCWWGLWGATVAGLWLVFSGLAGKREVVIFLLPVTVAALLAAWRAMVLAPPARAVTPFRGAVALIGAFLALNLLWMIPVFRLLGPQRFATDVLFIGADFERFYFLLHPPVAFGTVSVLAGLILVALLPSWLGRFRVPADLLGVTGVVVALGGIRWLQGHALMPQGFLAAVSSAYEAGVFSVTLAFSWAGLLVAARSIGVGEEYRLPSLGWVTATVGATAMYCALYPRTDYMHWVTAAPLCLVVVAAVLARIIDRWTASLSRSRRAVAIAAFVCPLLVLAALKAAPGIKATVRIEGGRIARPDRVWLENDRAPVWINAGRAPRYRELAQAARYLSTATEASEKVFTFPSLDILSFLSDRHNPTRHGYFFPRWPGRDVEAEVVAYLMKTRPRLVVVLHHDSLFFGQAPAYYATLRSYLEREYRRLGAIGRYVIAVRRDAEAAPVPVLSLEQRASAVPSAGAGSVATDPSVLDQAARRFEEQYIGWIGTALRHGPPEVRNAAVWALAHCQDGRCGAVLARAVRRNALAPRESILALRVAGQCGDERAVRALFAIATGGRGRISDEAATALLFVTTRTMFRDYWLFREDPQDHERWLPVARRRARQVLNWAGADGMDRRLRVYAVRATGEIDGERANELLEEVAESGDLLLKQIAFSALAEKSPDGELLARAVALLAFDDLIAPNVVITASRSLANEVPLARAMRSAVTGKRELATWLAALGRTDRTAKAAARNLADPDKKVREAAIWALHYRSRRDLVGRIEPLLADRDEGVRRFARRAVEALREKVR